MSWREFDCGPFVCFSLGHNIMYACQYNAYRHFFLLPLHRAASLTCNAMCIRGLKRNPYHTIVAHGPHSIGWSSVSVATHRHRHMQ